MASYSTIKASRKAGETLSVDALKGAIASQETVVGSAACAVARATATLVGVAKDSPFPSDDAKVAVAHAVATHAKETERLSKLYRWLDLATLPEEPTLPEGYK